ncbi:hypothetical protein Pelo_14492 [Pelomyxa schiedti]|nr:hypothetical protein Pelo_14492 [Pelomyxa schiedti]
MDAGHKVTSSSKSTVVPAGESTSNSMLPSNARGKQGDAMAKSKQPTDDPRYIWLEQSTSYTTAQAGNLSEYAMPSQQCPTPQFANLTSIRSDTSNTHATNTQTGSGSHSANVIPCANMSCQSNGLCPIDTRVNPSSQSAAPPGINALRHQPTSRETTAPIEGSVVPTDCQNRNKTPVQAGVEVPVHLNPLNQGNLQSVPQEDIVYTNGGAEMRVVEAQVLKVKVEALIQAAQAEEEQVSAMDQTALLKRTSVKDEIQRKTEVEAKKGTREKDPVLVPAVKVQVGKEGRVEVEAEAGVEVKVEVKTEVEAKAGAGAEVEVEAAGTDLEQEPEAEAREAGATVAAEAGVRARVVAGAGVRVRAEAGAEAKVEVRAETGA